MFMIAFLWWFSWLVCAVAGIGKCCNVSEGDYIALRRCVSGNANSISLHRDIGPHLRIAVVTYGTTDILSYTAYSAAVNQAFTDHHGYYLRLLDETTSSFDSDDHRWNKIKILLDSIDPVDGWAMDLDYVLWLDADAILLNMSLRLDSFISRYPMAKLIVSAEYAGSTTLINSGSILIRNCEWTRKFLSLWWSCADRRLYSDQEQFDLLYHRLLKENAPSATSASPSPFKFRKRDVAILAAWELNSDPPAMTRQQPHHPVLHLMGEHDYFRKVIFQYGWNTICTAINSTNVHQEGTYGDMVGGGDEAPLLAQQVDLLHEESSPLLFPHQLGITKCHLLLETLRVYSQLSVDAIQNFSHVLNTNGSPDITPSTAISRALANVVHHYAHALEFYITQHKGNVSECSWLCDKEGSGSFSTHSNSHPIDCMYVHRFHDVMSGIMPLADDVDLDLALSSKGNGTCISDLEAVIGHVGVLESGDILSSSSSSGGEGEMNEIEVVRRGEYLLYQLRWVVYQLLVRNIEKKREHFRLTSGTRPRIGSTKQVSCAMFYALPDMLELLKATAEAGQHLVSSHNAYVARIPMKQRLSVAEQIMGLLVEITECCHVDQKNAVFQMMSQLHIDVGMLVISSINASSSSVVSTKRLHVALRHFERSYDLALSAAALMGDHLLLGPLVALADTCAKLGRIKQSKEFRNQAIHIGAKYTHFTHNW